MIVKETIEIDMTATKVLPVFFILRRASEFIAKNSKGTKYLTAVMLCVRRPLQAGHPHGDQCGG